MSETAITVKDATNSPIIRMAERYGTTPEMMTKAIESVCFRPDKEGNTPPNELKLAFYLVCEAHGFNPLAREIFALYDAGKGQLMPYVSIDGWLRKANEHPDYDGMEVTIDGHADSKYRDGSVFRHPTGATCKIWRKGQSRPVVWQESWDENFRPNNWEKGPWYDRPERMMKWKATIQCIRVAFHLSGVMDEQEANEAIYGATPRIDRKAQEEAAKAQVALAAAQARGHYENREEQEAGAAKVQKAIEQAQAEPTYTRIEPEVVERVEKKGKFLRIRVVLKDGTELVSEDESHFATLDLAQQGIATEAVVADGRIVKVRDAS